MRRRAIIIVNGCVAWSGEGGGSAGPPQLLSSSAPRSSAPQLLSSSGLCRWPEWEAMLSNESPIWVRDTCGTVAGPDTGGECSDEKYGGGGEPK